MADPSPKWYTLHYTAHASAFAKELCSAHFIDGFIGMLQNVEFVVDNAAVGGPLLNAIGERPPHSYTSGLNSFPLSGTQLGSEKLIEGFLLAILAEPQGLPVSKLLTTVMNFICLPK
jgi:hypothetical protein